MSRGWVRVSAIASEHVPVQVRIDARQTRVHEGVRIEVEPRPRPRQAPSPFTGLAVRRLTETRFEIDGAQLALLLEDPEEMRVSATRWPANHWNNWRNGWIAGDLLPRDMLSPLGLRFEDRLHRIDDIPLGSWSGSVSALSRLQSLRSNASFTVEFERNGVRRKHEYLLR